MVEGFVDLQLEAHSGLFISGMIALLALAFVCLWVRQRQNVHILAYAAAFFLFSIAVYLSPLVQTAVTITTIVVGNVSVVLAALCTSWAFSKRAGVAGPLMTIVLVGFAGTLVTCWATVNYEHITYQMASNTSLYAYLFVLSAWPLRQAAFQFEVESLVFWAFVMSALQVHSVAFFTLLDDLPLSIATFQQTAYWIALNYIGAVCALSIAISLFTMCAIDAFKNIEANAHLDPLTGIATRKALFDEVQAIWSEPQENAPILSIVVADLDQFRIINNKLGRSAGDDALRLFGRLVSEVLPKRGVAGRTGGEEFCIVLPGTKLSAAHRIAETLRYQFEVGSAALSPDYDPETASFGVAQRSEGDSFEALLRKCDALLYEAKQLGRNQVRSDSEFSLESQLTWASSRPVAFS